MSETTIRRRPSLFKRQLMVDRKMQVSILLYTIFVSAVTLLFVGCCVVILTSISDDVSFQNARFLVTILLLWIISTALLSFLGAYVTNRIAGPIYRLRKNMQSVGAGNEIENVKFRQDDQFIEMADEYNRVLARLRKAETGN